MHKKLQNNSFDVAYTVDNSFDDDRFLKLRLRVCHDGLSPNRTFMTKDVMAKAEPTIANIPILAHTIYDEDGKPKLGSHDSHVEEHKLKDGEYKVIYDEIPVGLVPSMHENNYTIEEYDGKNYAFVDCFIWRDYANYVEDIVESAVDTKLSMEISIPEEGVEFNAKEKYWNILEYKYRGITLLNDSLGTGMENALATTQNFASTENEDIKAKMLVLMEELQDCLNRYQKNNQEGGNQMGKLAELLEKYGKTVEDITFEHEGLSDEELEAKFEEVFTEGDTNDNDVVTTDNEGETTEGEATEGEATEVTEGDDGVATEDEVENSNFSKTFELSHDDIRCGLYNLLAPYEESDQEWYYIQSVYDGYFVYRSYGIEGKIFKQAYKVDGDNMSLDGERIELFEELLTASEKAELTAMRENYSLLAEFKANADATALKMEKDTILCSKKYSVLENEQAFKELKANAEKYSVEEIEKECKVIFAEYVMSVGQFSAQTEEKQNGKIGVNFTNEESKPVDEYNGLFDILNQ